MKLNTLLSVIDSDQTIQIEHNHKTIFKGKPDDFDLGIYYERLEVKCIWHSQLYGGIMIEI